MARTFRRFISSDTSYETLVYRRAEVARSHLAPRHKETTESLDIIALTLFGFFVIERLNTRS
jgi:hypothetical protein